MAKRRLPEPMDAPGAVRALLEWIEGWRGTEGGVDLARNAMFEALARSLAMDGGALGMVRELAVYNVLACEMAGELASGRTETSVVRVNN